MDFQTRPDVCEYMAKMIPSQTSAVLEPTPGKGNLVHAIRLRGYECIAPMDFWGVTGKYECICMNPPFTPMKLGYKILYRCMGMSDSIIALMPWLTLINSQKRTADINDFGLVSVTHLPRNVFPGARIQACILQMQRGHTEKTELKFF